MNSHKKALADQIDADLRELKQAYRDEADKCFRTYINYLLGKRHETSIVVKTVRQLDNLILRIENLKAVYAKAAWHDFEMAISRIFDYEKRFRDAASWNTGMYIDAMIKSGLVYCPYCNMNTIESHHAVNRQNGYHKSPLDHYYSKQEYPYLSLSIYNLIPTCDRCNNLKGRKQVFLKTHTHPFMDDFHCLAQFDVFSKDGFGLLYDNAWDQPFTIKLEKTNSRRNSVRALNFADCLEIETRYNTKSGKNVAIAVLNKAVKYREKGLELYQEIAALKGVDLELVLSDEFGVSLDGSDINKTHFGKLRNDLIPPELKC